MMSASLNSGLTEKERHERKRMTAILYQKYKNRQNATNPRSKEIPKGKPDCLIGLSFLVTGVLASLERDEASQVIKVFGGKIEKSIIKHLDYMVVGEEAGPKKIATAEEFGIKMISEDELFNLIREKSGETMNNYNQKTNSKEKLNTQDEDEVKEKKLKKEIKEIINPELKLIPEGKLDCLSNLSFLITGELKSMDRDKAHQYIKKFGGTVSKSISKELDYVIVGKEPGSKKIAIAAELGLKMISEDDFYLLSLENHLKRIQDLQRIKVEANDN